MESAPAPVIVYDGVCGLCDGFVQRVIARDPAGKYRFAARQSAVGGRLLAEAGWVGDPPDSVVLIDADGVHVRSEASLRVLADLGPVRWLWRLARVVPRPLRDAAYDQVARRRYRWFGRHDACPIPSPAVRARFLDADDPVRQKA